MIVAKCFESELIECGNNLIKIVNDAGLMERLREQHVKTRAHQVIAHFSFFEHFRTISETNGIAREKPRISSNFVMANALTKTIHTHYSRTIH